MAPKEGETIVGIGCGDGSVLQRMAAQQPGARYYGVLPTKEEVARVNDHLRSDQIKIVQGLAEDLRLPNSFADKIVCNGVFVILPAIQNVTIALDEIARIARPSAMIFLGEIPHCDEVRRDAAIQEHRVAQMSRLRRIVVRLHEEGPIAIWHKIYLTLVRPFQSGVSNYLFHATTNEFVQMANKRDLKLVWRRTSITLDKQGNRIESETRFDYLFAMKSI